MAFVFKSVPCIDVVITKGEIDEFNCDYRYTKLIFEPESICVCNVCVYIYINI